MKESKFKRKILVAVDGSKQSVRAIRYAANVFPPDGTKIVLFNIQEQLLDLFSDLAPYPHYHRRVAGIKHWATEQKREITNTVDSAAVYFKQKGFPESAISIKIPTKKLGITQDIIKESYDGYHAIVIGRTGWSRFKDWLIKSTAMRLIGKIRHIPVVVVGGNPDAKNLLVAFDGTHGAMRGVAGISALVGTSGHHLQLYCMISHEGKFWVGDDEFFIPDNANDPVEVGTHKIGPYLAEARSRLIDEGMESDLVSIKIEAVDRDRPIHIVKEAMDNQYGGVVMGRRGMISFIDSYFIGRISTRVLTLADQLAVWII